MTLNDVLLPEFDQEMASTRRLLARVPDTDPDWKPHGKSRSMGALALHLAELPGWAASALKTGSYDLAPPGGPQRARATWTSRAAALELFDRSVAAARAALAAMDDAAYQQPWSLLRSGSVMLTLPRAGFVRSFLLNHLIHHRGQMTVYLRLRDVAVPGMYGPTADEGG
jgi:uncharacterized damage-inducible protein DinB